MLIVAFLCDLVDCVSSYLDGVRSRRDYLQPPWSWDIAQCCVKQQTKQTVQSHAVHATSLWLINKGTLFHIQVSYHLTETQFLESKTFKTCSKRLIKIFRPVFSLTGYVSPACESHGDNLFVDKVWTTHCEEIDRSASSDLQKKTILVKWWSRYKAR